VDILVCLSNYWKEYFQKEFALNNVFVVNNIIERPFISIYPSEDNNKCNILFLGLLSENKGVYDLLNVINKNKDKYQDKFTLYIGGNGEVEKVQSFIKNNDLENMVYFKGWITGVAKRELFSMSDIYILPSYNEGLPISVLEAMSYGLPIISTNVGGIPEIVEDGVNGLLIEPGNLKQIEEAIDKLIEGKELRKSMGEKGKEKVSVHYPECVSEQLEEICSYLLSKI
jgi:glycosyltransferase involved in cell wall biosynthesis